MGVYKHTRDNTHKAQRLPRNLHFNTHRAPYHEICTSRSTKGLHPPRNLYFKVHKALHLPQNLNFKDHKALRLPRSLCATKSALEVPHSAAPATKSAHQDSHRARGKMDYTILNAKLCRRRSQQGTRWKSNRHGLAGLPRKMECLKQVKCTTMCEMLACLCKLRK